MTVCLSMIDKQRRGNMRRVNAILSVGIVLLLVIHAMSGGIQMIGNIAEAPIVLNKIARLMLVLVFVHMIIGTILTIQTLNVSKKAGVHYFRENRLFWIRRISGFVLIILVVLHLLWFLNTGVGIFVIGYFGIPRLVAQILMVLALALHLICNIKPISIGLGLYNESGYSKGVLELLTVIMLFCAAAFVVFYLRWNGYWRA